MVIAPPVDAASCCRRPSALRHYPRTAGKTLPQRNTFITLGLRSGWPGGASLSDPNRVFRHRALTQFDSLNRIAARPRGVFGCCGAAVRRTRDRSEKQLGVSEAMPDAEPPLITTERLDPQRRSKHAAQSCNGSQGNSRLLNSTSTSPPSSQALTTGRASDPTASAPSPPAPEDPSHPWTLRCIVSPSTPPTAS
jgi:hypothetical protein